MAWKRLFVAAALIATTASTASADWHSFWHRFHLDYHRNNAWPHPFRELAAMQTRAPFEVQKLNGWRVHNTISHELFVAGDGQLTYAGQRQLENIMTRVPPQYRAVFVVRAGSEAETQARLTAVRNSLARMRYAGGEKPEVSLIDRAPATSDGATASAINRQWLQVMPQPRLPDRQAPSVSGN